MIPLLSAFNETMSDEISSIIGKGFMIAFGSPLLIGLVTIVLFLALMYVVGFSLDVVIVVLAILVLAMVSLPLVNGAPVIPLAYPVLPPIFTLIVVVAIIGIVLIAIFKFTRR